MTSFDNALKSDEGNSVYPPDLAKAIFELDIPDRIYLKTAMEFDDKYIVNKGNKWTFDYSGSRRYLVFNQDYISNKLNKYICFKYASTRFSTKLPALHLDWRNIISYCREHGGFSLSTLRLFIEKEDIDNATFYSVLFGLKILCAETFPGFNLEDYDDLEFVPRPYLEHWGGYQEIDNILDPLEKNMICNGLFEMASLLRDGKSFSHSEVRNAAILDVVMNEDDCKIRRGNAAELFSGIRHIAINILTNDKVFKAGLRRKMRKAAMDRNYLASVLAGSGLS